MFRLFTRTPSHPLQTTTASRLATDLLIGLEAIAPVLPASAEIFPSRPLQLLIPFPPGSPTDNALRALAVAASRELGQQVVAANCPGAGATLAASVVAQTSEPDGYTMAIIPASMFSLPRLNHLQKTSYDPIRDLTYIIGLLNYRFGIVTHPDAPWKDIREMLADAKANPGKVTYASSGSGTSGHVAMERLAKAAGVEFNFVPFKDAAEEIPALLGGRVQLVAGPGWGSYAESGKVRALAVIDDQRHPRFQNVPTLQEAGYDIVAGSSLGVAGPKDMDPKVVKVLHDALRKAMNDPAYIKTLEASDLGQWYLSSEEYLKHAVDLFANASRFVPQPAIEPD